MLNKKDKCSILGSDITWINYKSGQIYQTVIQIVKYKTSFIILWTLNAKQLLLKTVLCHINNIQKKFLVFNKNVLVFPSIFLDFYVDCS